MEVIIQKESNALKISFTINEPADVARAIELLSKLAQVRVELLGTDLSATYEQAGSYHWESKNAS